MTHMPRLSCAALTPCIMCGKEVQHSTLPMFYRATVDQCCVDTQALTDLATAISQAPAKNRAEVALTFPDPVVAMEKTTAFNLCVDCAGTTNVQIAFAVQVSRSEHAEFCSGGSLDA